MVERAPQSQHLIRIRIKYLLDNGPNAASTLRTTSPSYRRPAGHARGHPTAEHAQNAKKSSIKKVRKCGKRHFRPFF